MKKKDTTTAIEAQLRAALRGEALPQFRKTIRKDFNPPHHHPYKTTYIYSVQEAWGGPRFHVEFSLNTFNETEVQQYAQRMIAERGYINVVLLDKVKS